MTEPAPSGNKLQSYSPSDGTDTNSTDDEVPLSSRMVNAAKEVTTVLGDLIDEAKSHQSGELSDQVDTER